MAGAGSGSVAYVCGTFDTKGAELHYLAELLRGGRPAVRDGRSRHAGAGRPGRRDRRRGRRLLTRTASAPCSGGDDRGAAMAAMAEAFERWLADRPDVGGMIGAGGSGNTALVAPAMRALPVGVPKVLVSTVASGNVAALCRPGRHLHDALGHRRAGAQPHLAPGAGQRRARAGRHDAARRCRDRRRPTSPRSG